MEKLKLYPHQLEIIEKAETIPQLALLWDVGSGKTGATINIIRNHFNKNKRIMRTLILTPQVTLENWKDEILKFSNIKEDYIHIIGHSGKKRIKLLQTHTESNAPNIILINYEALLNTVIYDQLLLWSAEIIVADEMHLIKSPKSKRAKNAVKIADALRKQGGFVYGLTGTAILNSIEDIFMQYRFLDGGERFGSNEFIFRRTYMEPEQKHWIAGREVITKWRPIKSMLPLINDKIYSIATRVTKEEALPFLPPLVKMVRKIEMGKEQARLYKEMHEDFITFLKPTDLESAVTAQAAIVKSLRLMQIASGFVTSETGEEVEIKDSQKIKDLEELIESILPNKMIIWYKWRFNKKQIARLLDKKKIKHVEINGDVTGEDKAVAIKDFREQEDIKVMLCNRACGIGFNLVEAAYSIVFSKDHNLGHDKQSEGRNHRKGSEMHDKVVRIDLISKGTIDELVHKVVINKQELSDYILDVENF